MNEELKLCPFCGGAARIESNRDWHRLYANHDDDCVFDADDHDLMYPAQPGYLIEIAQVWNRRTPVSGESHGCPKDTPYGPAVCGECVDDHAKRADGGDNADEHAAYVDWVNSFHPEARSHLTPWNGWQARGQQAGMREVGRSALDEFIDKVCRNDAKLISCAESAFYWFNKCLAAIPGEAK